MVNKDLTEIICILDRSSSMNLIKSAALEGLNSFIQSQKDLKAGDAKLTLVTFNEGYSTVYDGKPIQEVDLISDEMYRCEGMTALYDALGRTIDAVGNRLANTPEEQRPGKVLVTIQTDGEENSSIEYRDVMKLQEKVKHQTDNYQWEFVFLSAGLKAKETGRMMGIADRNIIGFTADTTGIKDAYRGMTRSYCAARTGGDMSSGYNSSQ